MFLEETDKSIVKWKNSGNEVFSFAEETVSASALALPAVV